MMESLGYFFMSWLDVKMLLLTAAGTFAGIYIGAIPGLSVTMAVSILILICSAILAHSRLDV